MSKEKKKPLVVVILQVRMGSTRLPGKSMREILGRPLLFYQLERLADCKHVDKIVVATTNSPLDRIIVDYCRKLRIPVFMGDENNVLLRYHKAALEYGAQVIVRVTGDCPLIDPLLVDQMIEYFLKHKNQYEYCSNVLDRTYPRGLDAEIFSIECLEKLVKYSTADELEHVTLYLVHHPDRFKVCSFKGEKDLSTYRWTVDTIEDFELIKKIIEALYPKNKKFTTKNILDLYKKNPQLHEINAHIKQKTYAKVDT